MKMPFGFIAESLAENAIRLSCDMLFTKC